MVLLRPCTNQTWFVTYLTYVLHHGYLNFFQIMRFFSNPRKPMILALARPDPKKNITTLVKAFGEHPGLRKLANLTLIMGNRDVIDEMASTNGAVLTSVLKLIDKYDLYGQVAYPKHHKQSEVPDIYRLAARTKRVFINCAYIEPFGLTLIGAAAYGLPMAATRNGGPVDIHRVLDNGILVDPRNQNDIAEALYKLVSACGHNAVRLVWKISIDFLGLNIERTICHGLACRSLDIHDGKGVTMLLKFLKQIHLATL